MRRQHLGQSWFVVLLLAATFIPASSCAVLGLIVPCDSTAACPTGVCVDGYCEDVGPDAGPGCGEGDTLERCGEVEIPCIYQGGVVVTEVTGPGCVPSLEEALASDAAFIWMAPGEWVRPARPWAGDGQTIGGAGGVMLVGEAPLFELEEGGLTLEGLVLNVDADGPAISGTRAAVPNFMPVLTLRDMDFAGGVKAIDLREFALVADNVGFGALAGAEPGVSAVSTVDGFESHRLTRVTFDGMGAVFEGPNRVFLQGSFVTVSPEHPLRIAAAATIDSTDFSVDGVSCNEALLWEGGNQEERPTEMKDVTFEVPEGCAAIRIVPGTTKVTFDLGSQVVEADPNSKEQGRNIFTSSPGLVIEDRASTSAITIDATGNTWRGEPTAVCGDDIIVNDGETAVTWTADGGPCTGP